MIAIWLTILNVTSRGVSKTNSICVDFENGFGEKMVEFLSFIADEKIEELKEKVNEGESFNT